MPLLTIHHKTEYRYARPVAFGEHRIMLRPRDGHDLRVLESIGAEAICAAVRARRIVVIDEIGPMEIRSPVFCNVVNDALDSPDVAGILGTISARPFPFTNAIKKRHDIILIDFGRIIVSN